ncbi:K+ channel tetramerization domain protein [Teladorsagia circumcincta]|uniref:K+ channel tetramerization domain protein n=1 Tax=Teladorsagia circumcincta TaxID=45464 RepID=A0A2G9ULB4_TELCI|nr:K+ channel tetramerization domain protein [Teladorsagia circumcincta]
MVVGALLSTNLIQVDKRSSTVKQTPCDTNDEIELNIGGKHFVAHVADLKRYPKTMLARMVDQIWRKDLGTRSIFIDRSPKYFKLILDFIANNTVHLPRSAIELDEIIQEAEFYQLDELIALTLCEDRRCFGEGPPFFPQDRFVIALLFTVDSDVVWGGSYIKDSIETVARLRKWLGKLGKDTKYESVRVWGVVPQWKTRPFSFNRAVEGVEPRRTVVAFAAQASTYKLSKSLRLR